MPRIAPPAPLESELERRRLGDVLTRRWSTPILVMRAPAGSGKTTAMAQAIRSNAADPRGLDLWLGCTPADADASRLALGILETLGVEPGGGDPALAFADAVATRSPDHVALFIDDVHHIGEDSTGAALLRSLVQEAPANLSFVLSTRGEVPIPLARGVAAGTVQLVGDRSHYWFDDVEREQLVELHDLPDRAAVDRFDGWPAITMLDAMGASDVAADYVAEEVVRGLDSETRRALAALAALHEATVDELSALTGLHELALNVVTDLPLVRRDGDTVSMHDLLAVALADHESLDRSEVLELLLERGDHERALVEAGRSGADTVERVLLDALASSIPTFPADTARRWESWLDERNVDVPARRLMRVAAGLDTLSPLDTLSELEAHYRAAEQGAVVLTTLAITANVAYRLGDFGKVLGVQAQLEEMSGELPGYLAAVRVAVRAVLADLSGDPTEALRHLSEIDLTALPGELRVQLTRLRVANLVTLGRPGEARGIADMVLADSSDPQVARTPATVRWFEGDPMPVRTLSLGDDPSRGEGIEQLIALSFRVHFAAAFGMPAEVGDLMGATGGVPRLRVMAAVAMAVQTLFSAGEPAAGAMLREQLSDLDVSQPILQLELRRFYSVALVLAPELIVEGLDTGPAHSRARDLVVQFEDLRAGRSPGDPPTVERLLTSFPLPWTLEFLARAHGSGLTSSASVGAAVADAVGPAFGAVSEQCAHVLDIDIAPLAAALPTPPPHSTRLCLLGPFQVERDGEPVDDALLRRERVRQLVTLLATADMTRDQLVEVLWPWPDTDVDKGVRNLRTNLTHVRRLLEPQLASRQPAYHLRTIGESLSLGGAGLTCDLWDFERLVGEAAEADTRGQVESALDAYEAAAELWRGPPLTDLPGDDSAQVETIRRQARHAAVRASELALSRGDLDRAGPLAERALSIDAWNIGVHRAAIAVALASGEPESVRRAVSRLDEHVAEGLVALTEEAERVVRRARDFVREAAPAD